MNIHNIVLVETFIRLAKGMIAALEKWVEARKASDHS
jgi:hypothetical protein